MYEPLLDYARRNNQELIRRLALEKQLRGLRSTHTTRRSNLRLTVSNILFTLGDKIRPQEFEVYNECKVNRCNLYADIT